MREAAELTGAYWTVWAGMLVNRLGGFIVPFLALYLTSERGFGAAKAAIIVSLYGGGGMVAALCGGVLADRIGRRITMVASFGLGGASVLLLAFSRQEAMIAVAVLAAGFCASLYRPAVSALVADLVTPSGRVRAYGLLYWAHNIGAALAPLIAAAVLSVGFTALFIADGATTLLFALLILRRVPETLPPHRNEDSFGAAVAGAARGLAAPFRDGTTLAFCCLSFLVILIYVQKQVALPLDLQARGISAQTFGLVIAVNGLLIVTLQPFASRYLGRFDRPLMLTVACALIGVGFGLNAFVTTVPLYAVGVAVWTLGEILQAPVAPSVVADLAGENERGTYQGAYYLTWQLAAFLGPLLAGVIIEGFGLQMLWVGCLALGVVVAAGYAGFSSMLRRQLEARLNKPGTALKE